jgi:hypothetical protein
MSIITGGVKISATNPTKAPKGTAKLRALPAPPDLIENKNTTIKATTKKKTASPTLTDNQTRMKTAQLRSRHEFLSKPSL